MDGIMGAGPIGDMGRAVERATANMSPDQKQEYLRQAALNGIDPRVNNIALLQIMSMQLDRLKQPQARPPQGGTVRQQLNQAVMMKDRQEQEAALRAQIAEAMQRRAAEREMAMDRGVGGLDAGTMENPSFAGGGMVAFAGGGTPPKKTGLEALIASQEDELKGGLDAYAARTLAAQEALREKYGVGKDSEYDKAMQEEIARLQEQAAGYGERAGREDLASYFFNVAAEAAKPGATFIGSYAKAAPGYAAARKQTQKDVLQVNDQARTAKLKMLQAKDLERRGDIDNAFKLYNEGKKEYADAVVKYEQIQSNRAMVNAQMSPKGVDAVRYEAAKLMQKHANNPDSPEYKNAERLYNSITPGIAAAAARGEGRMPDNIKLPYKAALDTVKALAAFPSTYPEKAKALKERDYWRNVARSKGFDPAEAGDAESPAASTAPAPATGQAPAGGKYPGFNATLID